MTDENQSLFDPTTKDLNTFNRNRSFKRNASIKSYGNQSFARSQSLKSNRSLARTQSIRSRKSRISLDEKTSKSARKVAISSLIFNIGIIIIAQLSISFKHFLLPEACYNNELNQNINAMTALDDPNCSQIFEIDVDALDNTFVSVTLFSVIFDLPANLMLIAAMKLEMAWLFLPWLVVTKVKILGCIVVCCLLMHFMDDIFTKKSIIQQRLASKQFVSNQLQEST